MPVCDAFLFRLFLPLRYHPLSRADFPLPDDIATRDSTHVHFTATMSRYYEMLNQRLDAFLAEKNMVTDLLTKAEKTTGVKKQYIAQGQFEMAFDIDTNCCFFLLQD